MQRHTKIPRLLIYAILIAYSHVGFGDDSAWDILKKGGNVVLMRHASADKSTGDPLLLKIGDCSGQRMLSSAGRKEAKFVGKVFRARSIPVDKVLASRYCRTQETAKLAFGRVTPWQPLDVLFALPEQDWEARTETVNKRISAYAGSGNLIMVTHRPNVEELTFEVIAQGEIMILAPDKKGGYDIIGRFKVKDLTIKWHDSIIITQSIFA